MPDLLDLLAASSALHERWASVLTSADVAAALVVVRLAHALGLHTLATMADDALCLVALTLLFGAVGVEPALTRGVVLADYGPGRNGRVTVAALIHVSSPRNAEAPTWEDRGFLPPRINRWRM